MTLSTVFSRRIALASAVSLSTIACSPISAQSDMQDTAGMQEVEEEQLVEKKGVKIVKRGKYAWKSKDGEIHHGITHDGQDHIQVFEGKDGAQKVYVMRSVSRVPHVRNQERELREPRAPRAPRAPHSRVMRIELEKANKEIERAKVELEEAVAEVEKEMAAIEDRDSAEYEGLNIAKNAIKSAMESLKDQHFDEQEIEIEIRKMDREIMHHLEGAMKDVHVQREIIVELQQDLQEEVKDARKDMRTMFIEIEEMGEGDERTMRLKAVKEMEEAMGGMAEHRLEALKKAEEELRKSRIELEKQIAEQKAKDEKAEKQSQNKGN